MTAAIQIADASASSGHPDRRRKFRLVELLLSTEPRLHPRLFSWLFASLWPLLADRDGLLPTWYGAIELRLDLREGAEREAFLRRYDPALTRFIAAWLRSGDVYVDVGANAGQLSAVAAHQVGADGRVLMIEPNPALSARLERLAKNNPFANMTVFGLALGESEEEKNLYISRSHPYSTLDPKYLPNYPLAQTVRVRVASLDTLLRPLDQAINIRLLKVDAQGYENRIIRGARELLAAQPPQAIVMESVIEGMEELRDSMSAAGYASFTLATQPSDAALCPCTEQPAAGANIVWLHRSAPHPLATQL